jgi:DNA-directed RNA polymerase subunit RPC12/RpoP
MNGTPGMKCSTCGSWGWDGGKASRCLAIRKMIGIEAGNLTIERCWHPEGTIMVIGERVVEQTTRYNHYKCWRCGWETTLQGKFRNYNLTCRKCGRLIQTPYDLDDVPLGTIYIWEEKEV